MTFQRALQVILAHEPHSIDKQDQSKLCIMGANSITSAALPPGPKYQQIDHQTPAFVETQYRTNNHCRLAGIGVFLARPTPLGSRPIHRSRSNVRNMQECTFVHRAEALERGGVSVGGFRHQAGG